MSDSSIRIRLKAGLAGGLEGSRHYPQFADEFASFLRERGVEVTASPGIEGASAVAKDPSWILPIVELVSVVPLGVITHLVSEYISEKKATRHPTVRLKIVKFDQRSGRQAAALQIEGSAEAVAQILEDIDGN